MPHPYLYLISDDKKPIVDIKNQYQSVPTTNSSSAQQQQQNVSGTSMSTDSSSASSVVVPPSSRPLLGVNGTGQRLDMTDKIANTTILQPEIANNGNGTAASADAKKNANQFPKKVLTATKAIAATGVSAAPAPAATVAAAAAAPVPASNNQTEETDLEKLIDTIDLPEDETLDSLKKKNLTLNTTSVSGVINNAFILLYRDLRLDYALVT